MANFDFFVIGGGSGGVRAARIAAGHDVRVGLAEELYLGGTCVNVGCVPKKLFTYAAHYAHDFEDARGYGWNASVPTHDWATLIANKDAEINRLNGIYRSMLDRAGVTTIDGRATLKDQHTVTVNGEDYTADKILIAVGGWPVKPDIPGAELAITSNEVFYLKNFPKRVAVVGGGYIGVEFAGIFNGLGAETHLIYRRDLFLRGFDMNIRKALAEEYKKQGIHLHFNTDIERIEPGLTAHLNTGDTLDVDCILYATGRKPKTDGLGLDTVGAQINDKGAITVGENYQTSVENIYAVGDVTDRINLTPVALAEGHKLADALFNKTERKFSYDNVASAVFSNPPIATVGLTEEEAQKQYGDIQVFESGFKPLKHTLTGRDERTYMKLIVDSATDQIVGCHMMGADAGEIIQGISIAINAGATKTIFDQTIGIHPTSAEEFVTMRTARKA